MVLQEEVLRLKELGLSQRKVSKQLNINRITVRRYWNGKKEPFQDPEPSWVSQVDWEYIESELKQGITRETLYTELSRAFKLPSYQNFCKQVKKKVQEEINVTVKIDRIPGDSIEVDYAGDSIEILNPATGEITSTELFVGALGFSKKIYAEFSLSQKLEDFIDSHVRMFEYFGGVSKYIVCDNLKSGVTKACKLDPLVNKTYHDMCKHYDLVVDPADSYSPKHKPNAEKGVDIIQRGFMQLVRHKTYTSLGELNRGLLIYLEELNAKTMKHRGVSRNDLFKEEKLKLTALPEHRYKMFYWKFAKVHADCHIQLSKNFYSVPFKYVGQEVEVKHNNSLVEVYKNNEQIAVHKTRRGHAQRSTVEAHYPEKQVVELQMSYRRIHHEAVQIGENTKSLVVAMFNEHRFPLKNLRRVQAVVALKKKYSREALEYASSKALLFNKLSYRYVDSCARSYKPERLTSKSGVPNREKQFTCLQGGQ